MSRFFILACIFLLAGAAFSQDTKDNKMRPVILD
jgi:hypothetical protein